MSDIRLQRRGEKILDAIVAKNSLVLRTSDSGDVTLEAIVAEAAARTLAAARGRPILAIQDTTEINFLFGRAAKRTGLDPAGDGVSPGAGGVWRKGVWGGKNGKLWDIYPEMTTSYHAASDHAAVWCDVEI